MNGIRSYALAAVATGILALISAFAVSADEVSVHVEVESQDVYVGEFFLMQVVVDGADKAEPPDLASLEGFVVEFMGGSNNSSQSISIINGRVQRVVQRGFIFTYRLTPTEAGRLTIPSLTVNVGGQSFSTHPVTIAVRRPTETEEFKLRINLSREACYVGEPVVMTVTWYLRRDVQDFNFTVPILDNDAFAFEDPEIEIDRRKKYFRIPIGGGEVIAEKGQGMLSGQNYATLEFKKVLVPRRPGTFVVPEVIVACEAVVGFSRRRDLLDDFFTDNFFRRNRGRLKKYVVPSNALSLHVSNLPLAGRPPGFSGHIGEYRISSSAEPTEVNVGDPITLTVVLEGPDYLGAVNLPPLSSQPELARDFKIPEERADGRIEGKRKIFSQTIRAKHEEVTEIPAIDLVYFDTESGRYMTASSDPIPLVVHETKVVTALDAEGVALGPTATPVEKWKEGIAYNYEGFDLITPQDFGLSSMVRDTGWLVAFIAPPSVYLLLLVGVVVVRRRRADPDAVRARGALKRLNAKLDSIQREAGISPARLCERVLEALREYLGDKLRVPGSTLTALDVERLLAERGTSPKRTDAITNVMFTCEEGTYAGEMFSAESRDGLIKRVREAAKEIERCLR